MIGGEIKTPGTEGPLAVPGTQEGRQGFRLLFGLGTKKGAAGTCMQAQRPHRTVLAEYVSRL